MTVAPGTLVGPYRLDRLLGRGGMAVVYEATQESIGRVVALKLVSPDLTDPGFVERFRHEGRMQATLDHPHVVTVYEAGTSEHGPYLAMRLIRGTTLADLIAEGALSAAHALDLLAQVAGALDAAHAAGLVHRDVKPRNILVAGDDAYLADFGLTKLGGATGVTATGQFMGTLAYVAPEIIQGGEAGPASDRYALAAVLFECLTGTVVFPRESQAAILYAHTNEPVPLASRRRDGIPPELDSVLIDGLAKAPEQRPASAAALIERARVALGSTELGPPEPLTLAVDDDATSAAPVRPVVVSRTRRWPLAAAALVGAAIALGVSTLGGSAAPALPAAPRGTVPLGSDLAHAGTPVDCRGHAITAAAPACTIFQASLPSATLIVPKAGVVRRWAVRSASGELALAVLRPRANGYFQVARTPDEFVSNRAVTTFPANVAVDANDRLGLVVIDGSGFGERGSGTTQRWIPSLNNGSKPPATGPPGELLLHVDYAPGAHPVLPKRLLGAAAAAAPAAQIVRERLVGRTRIELGLVGGHGVLDLSSGGVRYARIDVPDMHAPVSGLTSLTIDRESGQTLDIEVDFARPDSARLESHYFEASGRRISFDD